MLINDPDDVEPSTVSELTKLLEELVTGGAALGWIVPPTASEVADLLNDLAAQSAADDAAVALARVHGVLAGFGYWRRYERPTHRGLLHG